MVYAAPHLMYSACWFPRIVQCFIRLHQHAWLSNLQIRRRSQLTSVRLFHDPLDLFWGCFRDLPMYHTLHTLLHSVWCMQRQIWCIQHVDFHIFSNVLLESTSMLDLPAPATTYVVLELCYVEIFQEMCCWPVYRRGCKQLIVWAT